MPSIRVHRAAAAVLVAAALGSVAWAAPAAAAATAGQRFITETDLFRFVWVADPQISPDGRRVAFVRVTVNAKKDGYDQAVWTVATDGAAPPQPFTGGKQDSVPRWSPDGRWLAFTRAADAGKPAQLWVIATGGGEARALTDLPRAVSGLAWSPDGRSIAFASTTSDKDLGKRARKERDAKADEERESDVRVITRAAYRFNGAGYNDLEHPAHLWVVDVPTGPAPAAAPRRLTSGEFADGEPVWSRDGSRLYFTVDREKEPYYDSPINELDSVPAAGGAPTRVTGFDGSIGGFTQSPDGRSFAFTGTQNGRPVRSYDQPDLFVVDSAPGSVPRNLTTGYDFEVGGGGLAGDQHAPRGGRPARPVWSADGKSIVVATVERGRVNLERFDAASGRVTPVTTGDHEVVCFTETPSGGKLAVVISTATEIGDLFALDVASGKLSQLTHVNQELWSEIRITPPEEISYASFDGRKIAAWVQKPPDFDPAKKYPMILDIHGGPHGAYGYGFDHEFQWMAAKGYVVLYPNPRGSTSYGEELGNVIQYHYPGDDYKDLMAGVDELVKRGLVDPQKLGITGGSGGGILTNWAITQTDRFAAAVAQRSIADWYSFWFTADFTQFRETWFRAAPWQDPKDFAARSPITYIDKVKTPLMLIDGDADLRCPPASGGEEMFRALKYLKKPVVMVRFPGETHELSRSGQPWHRIERLHHIVGWFDRYLQGKKTDEYDVP